MIPANSLLRSLVHCFLFAVIGISSNVFSTQQIPTPDRVVAPPKVKEGKTDPARDSIQSLPLVAPPMSPMDVEELFMRVGLMPVSGPQFAEFQKALESAGATAQLSRQELDEGEYKKLVDAILASIAAEGYPSSNQIRIVKAVRAKAAAIDAALIDSASRPLVSPLGKGAQGLIGSAQLMHRADAAAATLTRANGMPLAFVTVTPAFASLTSLTGATLESARSLLLLDASARAEIAEQISIALLEGGVLLSERSSHELQMGLTQALANEIAVDPTSLKLVGIALQMRGAFAPASELAKLDATLIQSIESTFPPACAPHAILDLERSSLSGARSAIGGLDIPRLGSAAIETPNLTPELAKDVKNAVALWQRADNQSFITNLQGDAVLLSEGASFSKPIVAGEPQTWQLNPVSPSMQRFQQQVTNRIDRLRSRRAAEIAAEKEIQGIVGPEIWKAISPAQRATPAIK